MGKIDCSDDMLFEKTVSKETKFTGKVFRVEVKTITTPEGVTSHREIVLHNGGAAILPVDQDLNCYFVRQFRSPFEKVMTESPAGKVEPGEDPLDCAAREITEETGFTAGKIEHVGKMTATPGYCSEVINLYIATDLSFTGGSPDPNEYLRTVKCPLKEALEMAESGRIEDAKTLVLIYKAARRFGI
ncbi:MAG: NUDIX hydrolase [Ruminococcaceae bacterium]|nr:NUDIX hydrolase [Oscillospiraceae bacterium]